MKSFYSTLAFGLGASAAALKRQAATCDCNFNIQVNGFQSGLVGSLADGQIRVGPSFNTPIDFCFDEAAGTISDNLGRGCLVAGAPMQYQCDNVAVPASAGITIDNSGVISHNGSSVWYECLVDDSSNYNLYTADTGLATKCQQVQLTTAGNTTCGAPKVSTVSVVGPTMFSTIPASTVTAPAQVSTVTAPAQISTVSAPAASCPAASTVTLPAPAAITVTQIQQSGASIITITATSTSVQTTTVSAPAVTVTSTAPAQTVYVTSSAIKVSTQVATQSVPVTIVQSTTETKAVPTTQVSVQTSVATSVKTSVQTTPTTVVVSATPSTSSIVVAPTTSSIVVPVTSSSAAPTTSSSTKVVTISSTISSTVSSTSSAATACATAPINGQYACPEQCPLDLTNTAFEYPHNLAINGVNGYFGEVSANSTTSFTFDLPAALQGKTCNTYFALPVKSQLVTADYTLTGTGSVSFTSAGKQVASFSPAAGNKYLVASGPCAAGQSVSYEAKATVGEHLRWFQDWNACALGLFVVPQ